MPSEIREPKKLADWIELDYYKRPRGLKRWRRIIIWATFLLCLGGVGAALLAPKGKRLFQAGPLTLAHNMYNDKCSTCHVEKFETAKKFLPWNATIHPIDNKACTECHHEFQDGRQHNPQVRDEQEPSCASCHQEHRGKMSLTRVADVYCVNCHGDMVAHRKDAELGLRPDFPRNIHSFMDGHPTKSGSFPVDPGRLNFTHHKHLTSPLVPQERKDREPLDCFSCHRTDASGRYMEPITYKDHCKECHPLSVQLIGNFEPLPDLRKELRDEIGAELSRRKTEFNSRPALHAPLPEVRAELRDRLLVFAQGFDIQPNDPNRRFNAEKKLEVRDLLPRQRDPALGQTQWLVARALLPEQLKSIIERRDFVEIQRQPNDRLVQGRCTLCHQEDKENRAAAGPEQPGSPIIAEPRLPKVWMPHARFNHDRHRILQCAVCHENADKSTKTQDVLMPDLNVCLQCHKPETGVRHDCVECHTYHVRPRPKSLLKGLSIEKALGR